MITGFNTDVEFNERVYHVQTEDRGLDNPIVERLVYSGGEIVTARKTSYAELVESDTYSEGQVLTRMEVQHRELIREIRNGEFDTNGMKPFGHGIVTNRSLDEVVTAFLVENPDLAEAKPTPEPSPRGKKRARPSPARTATAGRASKKVGRSTKGA